MIQIRLISGETEKSYEDYTFVGADKWRLSYI
jgi:hypothetical protein